MLVNVLILFCACNLCDYEATHQQGHLTVHISSTYEGVCQVFLCNN